MATTKTKIMFEVHMYSLYRSFDVQVIARNEEEAIKKALKAYPRMNASTAVLIFSEVII